MVRAQRLDAPPFSPEGRAVGEGNDIKFALVSLLDATQNDMRLDAGAYEIEGKKARQIVENGKFPTKPLFGTDGLAKGFTLPRFKRIYLHKSDFPFFQPAQISDISPEPASFISGNTKTDMKKLEVHKGQVLLTCSGTVGQCSYVSETLNQKIFSHDLIRINAKSFPGFIYAFLKTEVGRRLVKSNEYGAVVSHIEPAHLEKVPVPDAPSIIQRQIDGFIKSSFRMRDESNVLVKTAKEELRKALSLPQIDKIKTQADRFARITEPCNFTIKIRHWHGRLDASYHLPIVDEILSVIEKNAECILPVGDPSISSSIVLPGRFKRVFVEKDNGLTFFGGKQMGQLDPENKKYLAPQHLKPKIRNALTLRENTTLISCSGSIGRVSIAPKHWDGWLGNNHIIRVIPRNIEIAGYIYAWLSSEYGEALIKRFTYGAVVDEVDANQIARVPLPLCKSKKAMKRINDLVIEANELRFQAYELEQKAIQTMNDRVLFAK